VSEAAGVKAIDALRDARAALLEYRGSVRGALSGATADVQRTMTWLSSDRLSYWKQQVRRRREKVANARTDLERAKLSAMDPRASCIDQKRALEHARRLLEEAEQRVEAVKRWGHKLDREIMQFKGGCAPLSRVVDADLERAAARLNLLIDRLEEYVHTKPGAAPKPPPSSDHEDPA